MDRAAEPASSIDAAIAVHKPIELLWPGAIALGGRPLPNKSTSMVTTPCHCPIEPWIEDNI